MGVVLYVTLMFISLTTTALFVQKFLVLSELSNILNGYIGRTQAFIYAQSCEKWFAFLYAQDNTATLTIFIQTKNNSLYFSRGFCEITHLNKLANKIVITTTGEAILFGKTYRETLTTQI